MPLVKAVLDTNVVVSALLKTGGREDLILQLGLSGQFELVVSPELLVEYESVLLRPRFGFNPPSIREILRLIHTRAHVVEATRKIGWLGTRTTIWFWNAH